MSCCVRRQNAEGRSEAATSRAGSKSAGHPFESGAASVRGQSGRNNKRKWLAPTGVLSVNGAKFMNWDCGRGSGGAISQVIHLHHLDFKAAVDWLGRNFPDTLSLSAAAPTAQLGLKLTAPAPSRSPTTLKNQCFREDYRVFATHSSRNRKVGLS